MRLASQSGAAADSASRAARSVSARNSSSHRRQHRGGISALPTSGLDHSEFAEPGQQQVQDLLLQPVIDESLSEPRQHRVIESRISQFQAQGVLPVDPTPYGVSGLPIGQILANCRTVTSADCPGEIPGLPRTPNAETNSSSANNPGNSSRTRIANVPFGNAARATAAVRSGISGHGRGWTDIKTTFPQPETTRQSHRASSINTDQHRGT